MNKPTYEDIIKYHSQGTKLLVDIDCYSMPMEIQIMNIIDDGAVFQFSNGWTPQWVKTESVSVLHIFPPRELLARMEQIKQAETKREIKSVLDKADEVNILTDEAIDEVIKEFGFSKPKKCRKKKKCK